MNIQGSIRGRPGNPREALAGAGRSREAQGIPKGPRDPREQGGPGRPRKAQRTPGQARQSQVRTGEARRVQEKPQMYILSKQNRR